MDIPKNLPFGETICSHCESFIKIDNENKFDCLICKEKHEMLKNKVLPMNKPLLAMLSIEPIKISRGNYFSCYRNH